LLIHHHLVHQAVQWVNGFLSHTPPFQSIFHFSLEMIFFLILIMFKKYIDIYSIKLILLNYL
jgi:hypothetical protein